MSHYLLTVKAYLTKNKWPVVAFLLAVLVLLILLLVGWQSSEKISQADQVLLKQLNDKLNHTARENIAQAAKISQIELKVNERFVQLNQYVHSLKAELTQLREQLANPQLAQTVHSVSHSTEQLSARVNQLQIRLNQIQQHMKQEAKPHYLPAKVLPFRVAGIDIWNGVIKVTVKLGDELNLLSINDSIAGWTLQNVATEPAIAVFKNKQNQFVKVDLS